MTTLQANFTVLAGAYIAAEAAPYLRASNIMLGLANVKNFRERSPSQEGASRVYFKSRGNLTAYVTAENTEITKSNYSDAKVYLDAQKVGVYVELTDEAETFGSEDADLDFLAQEAGEAIAEKIDIDGLALLDGFSQVVGTTNEPLTVLVMKDAPYKVRLSKVKGPLVYALHETQVRDIQGDIISSAASIWSGARELDILNGERPDGSVGFQGRLFNHSIYASTNNKSINTNVDWCGGCWSPRWAIAGGVLGRIKTMFEVNAQKVITGMSVYTYYNWMEWKDVAGCKIVSKK